jgi:hypothetical protein
MTLTYSVKLAIKDVGIVDIGDQLNLLTVTSGSSDGYDQPAPSTCAISFLGSPMLGTIDLTPNWWLGRYIGIMVTPSDGDLAGVFAGTVFSVQARPVDATCETVQIDLQLQSPVADYSNYIVTQDQVAQTEVERIDAWFADGEDVAWLEVGLNLQWEDVDLTKTWADYTNQNNLQPPAFSIFGADRNLLPYVADESRLNDVLQFYVTNNGGWMGEILTVNASATSVNCQTIFYDPDSFTNTAGADLDIAECAIFSEIGINSNLYNLFNYVEADNGVEVRSFEVPSSIDNHGLRDIQLSSSLSSTSDLDTLVTQKAIGRAEPVIGLSQLTIDYDLFDLPFRRIWFGGQPVLRYFSNVPSIFGGDKDYWVLGMTLSLTYQHAEATWNVIPQETLAYFDTWWSPSPTDTWNTYVTASTKWSDLT